MNRKFILPIHIFYNFIIACCLIFSIGANAQTTFSHGIVSGANPLVFFKPDTNIKWVDVHFNTGNGVQNVRMTVNQSTGRFEQAVNATTGTTIQYSFTYSIDGFVGFDTNVFTEIFSNASSAEISASSLAISSVSKSSSSANSSAKISSSLTNSSSSVSSTPLNIVTHGVDDHSTFVVAWLKPNAVVVEWADIHFAINGGGQQNVRLTFNADEARFEQIIATPNNSSLTIAYSFTHQTLNGAVDTSLFNFSRTPSSISLSSSLKSNSSSSVKSISSSVRSSSSVTTSSSVKSSSSVATSSSVKSSSSVSSIVVNVDRSLIVHDQATLQAADFSFRSTLQQLTNQFNAQNPTSTTTVEDLFSRWWDTQTPTPGNVIGGEKCTGQLNGFSVECRPAEGSQANNPNFFINNYIPIALINRLDLRDTASFRDCGEYRVIYASTSGLRNFIIFEAQVPNPTPGFASGCLTIAQFWKNLSAENDATLRATKLRNFYFQGIPSANVRAVIDIRNYTFGTGQIRANMFMGNSWDLKEFKTTTDSQGLSMIVPVSVKSNPVAFLFNGNISDPIAREFQNDFLNNLGTLLGDFNVFSLDVERDSHNNGQSHASGDVSENDYSSAFFNTNTNSFQQAVSNKIAALGSTLTQAQVMNRATAMTCGGCHQPDTFGLTVPDAIAPGKSWPVTLGFTHISEFANGGVFPLSPALTDVFLPTRLNGLNSFISSISSQATTLSTPLNISTINLNSTQSSSSSSSAPSQTTKPFNKRAG